METSNRGEVNAKQPNACHIGNDPKIIDQGLKVIGRVMLQVDGDIEDDAQAAEPHSARTRAIAAGGNSVESFRDSYM
jgi:hypothetical protein